MMTPEINTPVFQQLRFILVETSHPGNIGAAARAIKTMGFSDLVLLNPRFEHAQDDPEAIAFASGAQDILQNAKVVGTLEQALAGCHFAAAISARLREFSPPVFTPRALAAQWAQQAKTMAGFSTGALIFGNERYGLPNQIVEKCNALISIPANPGYGSLNLAQAVQVLAYECRLAAMGDTLAPTVVGFQGEAASVAQIDGMFEHLEQALVAIDFLNANNPKKLMPRLKRLFGRTALEVEEVNILRGIAKKILEAKAAATGRGSEE